MPGKNRKSPEKNKLAPFEIENRGASYIGQGHGKQRKLAQVGHGCGQDRAPGTDCITQLPQGTFPTFTGAGRFLVVPRQSQSRFYILGELGAEAPMRASRVQAVSVTSVVVSLELVGTPGEVVEITVVDALGLGSNLAPGTKWVVMKKQTTLSRAGSARLSFGEI
eukprot:COSAG04_NODE_333_length_16525_cov_32.050527_12_plen_165_part_00